MKRRPAGPVFLTVRRGPEGVKPTLFQFSRVRKRRLLPLLRKLEKCRFDPVLLI
jgi:hypothetical protein